ncbi:PREDICTED: uncharacterized protein LOC109339666 [Lupinus angustifolius]|uniref:uncharacterized protein LOC109339666 n=1 Tax=Lupinus angustifolius TaxID=3871 RepID=UPI00092F07AB|nr:PREDICTED: uncharacterized protein LOC109339666 [Lupinus angustifolius]
MQKGWVQESLSPYVVPLTPLDLLTIPNDSILKHRDGWAKEEYVQNLHEQVKAQIEKKNASYAKQANKGWKQVIFEPGDWVWVHMRKERFLEQRKFKLLLIGDGLLCVVNKVNYNVYKLELPSEYGNISATFNVSNLTPFDTGGDDVNPNEPKLDNDELRGIGGPVTRARAKRIQNILGLLMKGIKESAPRSDQGSSYFIHCVTPNTGQNEENVGHGRAPGYGQAMFASVQNSQNV